MKIYIPITIFVVIMLLVIFALPKLSIDGATDLSVVNDSTITVGEGEVCKTPNFEAQCQKGYECILGSTEPFENGVCRKIGTRLKPDNVNRPADNLSPTVQLDNDDPIFDYGLENNE